MPDFEQIKNILGTTLQLGDRVNQLTPDTPLLGNIPEMDSVAVITILTTIEEQFDIIVEDDEIDGEAFATVGSLVDFVNAKVA